MGLFKRMRVVEEKLDALAKEQGIKFEKQSEWGCKKSKKEEIGFKPKEVA